MYEFRNAFEYNDRIINLISDFVEYMTEIIGFTQRMPMSKRNDSAFDTDRLAERIRYSLLLDGYGVTMEQCRQALPAATESDCAQTAQLPEADRAQTAHLPEADRALPAHPPETDRSQAVRLPDDQQALNNLCRANALTDEDPFMTHQGLRKLHKVLMQDLSLSAGEYRKGQSVRFGTGDTMRILPVSGQIPAMLSELTDWYRRSSMHPLLRCIVFCAELTTIEPFAEDSIRMNCLLMGALLKKWRNILGYIPFETFLYRRKNEYQHILDQLIITGDSTKLIEFMLRIFYCALQAYDQELRSGTEITQSMQRLLDVMEEGQTYTNRELMALVAIRHRPTFRDNYLLPCIDAGLIEMTVPDKPNSRNQKYRRVSLR